MITRLAEARIRDLLARFPAVAVLGPRQVGKTTLALRLAGATDATFAYQGAGRGFDLGVLQTLEQWVQSSGTEAQGLLQPQLTIWFDLPPSVAAARLAGARVPDKFESQPMAFFEAVAGGYAARCEQDPLRFARIHADQSPEAVRKDVMAALAAKGFSVCAIALLFAPKQPFFEKIDIIFSCIA